MGGLIGVLESSPTAYVVDKHHAVLVVFFLHHEVVEPPRRYLNSRPRLPWSS